LAVHVQKQPSPDRSQVRAVRVAPCAHTARGFTTWSNLSARLSRMTSSGAALTKKPSPQLYDAEQITHTCVERSDKRFCALNCMPQREAHHPVARPEPCCFDWQLAGSYEILQPQELPSRHLFISRHHHVPVAAMSPWIKLNSQRRFSLKTASTSAASRDSR